VPHAFTTITNIPGSTGAGNKRFVLLRDNYYIENHATSPLKKVLLSPAKIRYEKGKKVTALTP
jgi:hypothetical protein